MAQTEKAGARRWTGKPWVARAIKLVAWLGPIAVSIIATHVLARIVPRPQGLALTTAWFLGMAVVATAILYVVDKVARRLLPLAALFNLSLVFPDRAPSRFKAALRTRTVHQLEQRVAEIRSAGLSDDPAIAAETLIELVADLSAHDRLTRGHAERVRAYSQMIGDELNLKESEVDMLQWAGLLHDVGKMFVPDEILNKTGRLTGEEFDVIKKHPEWGAELCEPLRGWLGEWVDAVGQHHERWDGKGYPAGLAGTDISLAARIVSVADVFDVITSVRSYKEAGGAEDARKELAACAGTQFDEKIVRAFLNVSLGKLRLAMGPLAWLAQLPVIGRASLLPVAGNAASAALAAGVLLAGGSLDETHEYEPARAEAAAPASTVESTVPMIVTTLAPPPAVAAPDSTVPQSSDPETTATTLPPPTTTTLPPPTTTTTTLPSATTTTVPPPTTTPATTTTSPTTRTAPSPIANDDVGTVAEGGFIDLDLGFNDEAIESLRLLTVPANGDVTQQAPSVYRYHAVGDFYGVTSFVYEAVGATGSTATATVTVTVTNTPDTPEAANDVATTSEYATVNIDALANDTDADGDALSITGVSAPSGIATTDGRSIDYSPTGESAGVHTIWYSVNDGTGLSDTATVQVTVRAVNLAPVLDPIGPRSVDEGATLSFIAVASDVDRPADDLTFSLQGDGGPVPPGATINPLTGRFTWTPSEADGGTTPGVRIVVSDDAIPRLTDAETITITVEDLNTSPVLQAIGDQTIEELTELSFNVSASDADLPADTITLSTTGLPAGAAFNIATGAFAWTPTDAQGPGSFDVTFTAADDGTGALIDSETITITVDPLNTPPVLTAIGDRSVDELSELAFTVTASDADLPADTVTLSANGLPAGAAFNTATGAFSWTPTEVQGPGAFDVTFTATDDGTGALTDAETITITVAEVNTPPVFSDPGDQFSVTGQVVTLPPVASDPDNPANDLVFAASGLPAGLGINSSTGVISGIPTANGSGTVTVTVTETDGVPTNLADAGTFDWTITSPSILISEIATSGSGGPTDEFVELYNPTSAGVEIGDWKLEISDGDGTNIATIPIPALTTIGANEYYLVANSSLSGGPVANLTFGINMAKGAGVSLVTDLNIPVDAVGTGPAPWKDGSGSLYGEGTFLPPLDGNVDQSYERRSGVGNCLDTGDNSADFFHNLTSRNPQGLGTFEACGSPPPFVPPPPAGHVVISELRLDGAEGGSNEFVEIYNAAPFAIDISGYRLYSQDGSLQGTVPLGTSLPTGKHYLFASTSFMTIEGIVPDVVSAGSIKNDEGVYLEDATSAVVDAVSTGGTAHVEGTSLPPINGRVIQSYERLVGANGGNCVDTDDNSADFFHNLSSQNPQTLAAPAAACAI